MFEKINHTQSKHIKNLHRKKNRQNFNEFVVEGTKSVLEFVNSDYKLVGIFALENWLNQYIDKLGTKKLFSVNSKQLSQISSFKNPQSVVGVFKIPQDCKAIFSDFILFLEDIRDPGNLGTIIRTAEWFGLQEIYCSKTCTDAYNTKVVQASMGSSSRVAVHYINFEQLATKNPNHSTVLADMNGTSLQQYQWAKQNILVIGNEANGISEHMKNLVKNKVTIVKKGKAESLNASISTAIILSHALQ